LKVASIDAIFRANKEIFPVRTTLSLDDDLLARAQEYTGVKEKSALVRLALEALVQREAARRLAAMGGTEPQLTDIPRRRPPYA
jgi:Arc/MetJ family transcription regulator